jgi:hypothetical protein
MQLLPIKNRICEKNIETSGTRLLRAMKNLPGRNTYPFPIPYNAREDSSEKRLLAD